LAGALEHLVPRFEHGPGHRIVVEDVRHDESLVTNRFERITFVFI
jgi:hypothetical protein